MEGVLFVVIATLVTVVITGIFILWQMKKLYKDCIRQMRKETVVPKQRTCNGKTLEALQHCWGLLIYTTDRENDRAIITYTVEREKDRKIRTYYFHKSNIDAFISSLCHFFYTEGWGLYLSKELKDLLFDYERILWKLKLPGDKSPDEVQIIRNYRVAEDLFELHQQLITIIRQDMRKIYYD